MQKVFSVILLVTVILSISSAKDIENYRPQERSLSQTQINELSEKALKNTLTNDPDFFKKNKNTIVIKTNLSVGDTASFYAINYAEMTYYLTDALLAAQGKNINIWLEISSMVENYDYKSWSDSVIYLFDEKSNSASIDPTIGVYDIDTTYFGTPPNFDGDNILDLLVLNFMEAPGLNFSIGGQFQIKDQQPAMENNGSNARDMIYISINNALNWGVNNAISTIAHEFQHLIHYHYDTEEYDWLNEAMSTLAQTYCGYGLYYPGQFLANPNNDFVIWDDYKDYYQVNLMSLYMAEQYGSEFIKKLVQSPYQSTTSLGYVFYEMNINTTVVDFFKNWIICNYVNDVSINSKWGYNHPDMQGMHVAVKSNVWDYPVNYSGETLNPAGTNYFKFTNGDSLSLELTSDFAFGQLIRYFDNGDVDVVEINPGENYTDNDFGNSISYSILAVSTLEDYTDFSFSATAQNSEFEYAELAYDDGITDYSPGGFNSIYIPTNCINNGWANCFELPNDNNWSPKAMKIFCNVYNGNVNIHLWDDDNGKPGIDIITPIPTTLVDGWNEIVINADEIEKLPQKFYMGFLYNTDDSKISVYIDSTTNENKTYRIQYTDSTYISAKFSDLSEGIYTGSNMMIRAIIYSNKAATGIVEELAPVSEQFSLAQNFPNPFNPTTMINYQLPIANDVKLEVFNLLGEKVATLVAEQQTAGQYSVIWNATNYSSGVYFYHLNTGEFSQVKKMLLIK